MKGKREKAVEKARENHRCPRRPAGDSAPAKGSALGYPGWEGYGSCLLQPLPLAVSSPSTCLSQPHVNTSGFPWTSLPQVLPKDEFIALDKALAFKGTSHPNDKKGISQALSDWPHHPWPGPGLTHSVLSRIFLLLQSSCQVGVKLGRASKQPHPGNASSTGRIFISPAPQEASADISFSPKIQIYVRAPSPSCVL